MKALHSYREQLGVIFLFAVPQAEQGVSAC